jgi:hypothetical protein
MTISTLSLPQNVENLGFSPQKNLDRGHNSFSRVAKWQNFSPILITRINQLVING